MTDPMRFPAETPWSDDAGPHAAVVMTSRTRLARNLAGFPFVGRATEAQRREVVEVVRTVLTAADMSPPFTWTDLGAIPQRARRLLVERHLISAALADCDIQRGVAITRDLAVSVMVNEEDHLRMQSLASGLRLRDTWRRIDAIDEYLAQRLSFAFSDRWGFLTACPTNVGTGVRFSVMLHLPALRLTEEIDRVRRAAQDLHLAVRGYYGEGSDSAGDFYQISNQITLGRAEEDLLAEIEEVIVPRIIEYELEARRMIESRSALLLDDRIHRALGLLRSARMLGTEEAMKLLSRVRLGVHMNRLADVDAATINRLFLEIQPAHLAAQVSSQMSGPISGSAEDESPDPDTLRQLRATIVREALSGDS